MKPCLRLLLLLLVVALAGACSPGAIPSVSPTATPGPTGAPAPSPTPAPTQANAHTPTPSPAATADRVTFSGTLDCGFPEGLEETREGAVTTYSGTIECTYETTDARASGTERGPITMVELNTPGYHVNKWFLEDDSLQAVITNAGGSWRITEAFGADQWDGSGAGHTVGTAAYIGEGGYDGLRMRLLYAQGTSEPVDAYVLMGWIEPAD